MDDKELQDLATSKGFEYVRESDDHYLIAAPSEMVALLRDLLGLDVRNKDYRDYGQSINDLKEQVDGLTNSLHALYVERDALKADIDRRIRADENIRKRWKEYTEELKADAERYRWISENADVDCRGKVPNGDYGSLDERIDAAIRSDL